MRVRVPKPVAIALAVFCGACGGGGLHNAPPPAPSAPKSWTIGVAPGVSLYVESLGSGKDTLVLLHGGPGLTAANVLPDKTMLQAIVWMNSGQSGPAPVAMLGGASGIAKGRHMFVTGDFQPGKYVLLCFIPDVKDGRPHSSHGMATEITIEP